MTVEWAILVGATYTALVSPLVPIECNGSTSSLQMLLQYNTEYNLSVVAVAPCGDNATAVITLHYGEA